MLLALDDTDSPEGGCTTALVGPLLEALGPDAAAGPPRLVRLHPNNPWKTRGNAAVVLDLRDDLDPVAVLATAETLVRAAARHTPGKGAGLLVLDRQPEATWYWRGVQGQLDQDEVREAIGEHLRATTGNGRGLIGAWCAAAWRPERPTWERISYRAPERIGTPRAVDVGRIAQVESRWPSLFDCYDRVNEHAVMVPHTRCPVLFGLRATAPADLDRAASGLAQEPVAWSTLFVTNQASDDHVTDDVLRPVRLTERPRAQRGGHVLARGLLDDGTPRQLIAFEPTGGLRAALLQARADDVVLPCGSLVDGAVHLEKVLHVPAARRARVACPSCGAALRSTGRGAPLRCRGCGHRQAARMVQDAAQWHEADVSARRHLARPLRLGLAARVEASRATLCSTPQQEPLSVPPRPTSP